MSKQTQSFHIVYSAADFSTESSIDTVLPEMTDSPSLHAPGIIRAYETATESVNNISVLVQTVEYYCNISPCLP